MAYEGQSVVVTHKAKDGVGPISFQARFVNDLCDGNCVVWSTHTHKEVVVQMDSVKAGAQ